MIRLNQVNLILKNDQPWEYDTRIIRYRGFLRRCLRAEGQIRRPHPAEELNSCMTSGRRQKRTPTSVSRNSPSTEAVFWFACRVIRSKYSRCSSDVRSDKWSTSIGGPKSTSRAHSPFHARLPVTTEGSWSEDGFDEHRSSFPILSVCLWKNRCSTTASVSSDVVPNQWSLLSSLVAEIFYSYQ